MKLRGRVISQQRLAQREGGGAEKLTDLQLRGSDFAGEVDGRLAAQKLDQQLALAHVAPAIDGNERAAFGPPRLFQGGQFLPATNEIRAHSGCRRIYMLQVVSHDLTSGNLI